MDQNNPWFKDLFLDNPIPRFIFDHQTLKIEAVNQAALDQYGYSEEEFLSKTPYDLRAKSEHANLKGILDGLGQNDIYIGHLKHLSSSGEVIEVQISAHPIIYRGSPARLIQALNITEQKTLEAQVDQVQRRFQALIEHSQDVITISDAEGKYIYVSPSFSKVTGYQPDEILHTLGRELVHPDELSSLARVGEELMLNPGMTLPMQNLLKRKDGTFVPVEGTLSNLLHEPSIQGVVANYREISQRLDSEKKIQRTDAIMRAVFESAIEGFVITDTNLVIQQFNKVARHHIFTNTKRQELIAGANLMDYISQDRKEFFRNMVARVMTGENLEYQTFDQHYRGRWINYCLYPVKDEGDEIIGICVVGKDITEKITYDEQMKLSEQRYRALIKEGSDLINIIDFEGNYQFITEASRSRLDAGVLGENAFQFVHEDDRETLRKEFELLKTHRRVKSSPYRFRIGDGQYIWMETVGTNLMDEPSVHGIVINSHDVSDAMNHIRAIEERNTRLEEIAWIHSHLVRAPLASILGIIEILKTSDTDFKELMPYLEQSAIQLDKVIAQITQKANDLTLPEGEERGKW
jgi:PAS domain S-box-containing protein